MADNPNEWREEFAEADEATCLKKLEELPLPVLRLMASHVAADPDNMKLFVLPPTRWDAYRKGLAAVNKLKLFMQEKGVDLKEAEQIKEFMHGKESVKDDRGFHKLMADQITGYQRLTMDLAITYGILLGFAPYIGAIPVAISTYDDQDKEKSATVDAGAAIYTMEL